MIQERQCRHVQYQTSAVCTAARGSAAVSTAKSHEQASNWGWALQVINPQRRSLSGQQLCLRTKRQLGTGGCGTVMEVRVKLCGGDSLTAVPNPNRALIRLLRRVKCQCSSQAEVHSNQQAAADDDSVRHTCSSRDEAGEQQMSDAAATCAAGSSCSCSCCSVRLALKIPIAYEGLPVSVTSQMNMEQYQQEAERQCFTEYALMDKCFASRHIIDCYSSSAYCWSYLSWAVQSVTP